MGCSHTCHLTVLLVKNVTKENGFYMVVYMTVVPDEEMFKQGTLVSIWTMTKL